MGYPQYDPELHLQRIQREQAYRQQYGTQLEYPQPPYPPESPPYGSYQPPRQPPPRRRKRRKLPAVLAGLVAMFIVIIAMAIANNHGTSTSGSTGGGGSAMGTGSTVTYIVTGSGAQVTYGPAGSDLSGNVPMKATAKIPSNAPDYYSISAQLQGDGKVSCEIEVSGKVVSSSIATGGYNIASCEIIQDPLSGNWQDANS
jgi:hypothetical protein